MKIVFSFDNQAKKKDQMNKKLQFRNKNHLITMMKTSDSKFYASLTNKKPWLISVYHMHIKKNAELTKNLNLEKKSSK